MFDMTEQLGEILDTLLSLLELGNKELLPALLDLIEAVKDLL